MKALIAGDHLASVQSFETMLTKLDFVKPFLFTDLKQALSWSKIEAPDLIILDLPTQQMDIVEFLKLSKHFTYQEHTPHIVLAPENHAQASHHILEAGALDFILKPVDPLDFIARCKNLLKIRDYQEEQRRTIQRLYEMATTDSLTKITNRANFLDRTRIEITRAQRHTTPVSIAMLDVDYFKTINDTYGHKMGDHVLKHIAQLCVYVLRRHDIVARIGGEEFALCMPETPLDKAEIVCNRLREIIADDIIEVGTTMVRCTVSIGVTQYHQEDNRDIEKCRSRADEALYAAKQAGRNKVIAR